MKNHAVCNALVPLSNPQTLPFFDVYFVNDNFIGFVDVNKTITYTGRPIHCEKSMYNEPSLLRSSRPKVFCKERCF